MSHDPCQMLLAGRTYGTWLRQLQVTGCGCTVTARRLERRTEQHSFQECSLDKGGAVGIVERVLPGVRRPEQVLLPARPFRRQPNVLRQSCIIFMQFLSLFFRQRMTAA